MNEIKGKTLDIKQLTEEIYRIRIAPEGSSVFPFKGGQYLYLQMCDGKRIPLSIASPPEEKKFIELHIRKIPGHPLAEEMLKLFESNKRIHLDGPYGECVLQAGSNPVIIIAGGTGFSPMKALLESAFAQKIARRFELYLGAQNETQLYQKKIVESWKVDSGEFKFIPVVAEPGDAWQGESGFPHEIAISKWRQKLSECEVFISGSEMMVMNVFQALKTQGVPVNQIHSDILDIKRDMGEEL
ncbi:hypothetical protein [Aliikangiella sp. G2MR2-5]|uniref:hypothetical protein n=1 Tax=Aliikangiella sp. G2MR2-5 TaxID=2788943 RepID=UPI0018AA0E01|nr:hypothetical protein [Aliikangiella sp. G2MR2-5]